MTKPVRSTRSHLSKVIRQTRTKVFIEYTKAFVKERIETGEDFPHTLFGAYVGQRAIIRGAK